MKSGKILSSILLFHFSSSEVMSEIYDEEREIEWVSQERCYSCLGESFEPCVGFGLHMMNKTSKLNVQLIQR
jgi:hypothetical protein